LCHLSFGYNINTKQKNNRYARLVATAWNSFFSDVGTLAAGVAVGLIMAGISAYVCTKTLRLKSKVTTGVIVGQYLCMK